MPTTPDDLYAIQTRMRALAEDLGAAATNFPEPCVPCPECPPQFPAERTATLAEVRDLFGSGAQYADRPGWEAAMGRRSRVRSEWAAGGSVDEHVKWWRSKVSNIIEDDGETVYVIGMHPWPGLSGPPATPPTAYYAQVAAELARLDPADAARVWVRFGWEPDGDWYVWSWRPKGGVFTEARYAAYVRGWRAFDGALADTGVRLTLSATAGMPQDLAERALRDLSPAAYTMDVYATWDMRSVVKWLRRLTEQVETAERFGLPWGIDETSPYVDKTVGGQQKGSLDSKLSIELLHALVYFVQVQTGAGRAPLWVQFFERNPAEGKFAMVSINTAASASNAYRAANGGLRYTTAPRTAQALVALLGTPQ